MYGRFSAGLVLLMMTGALACASEPRDTEPFSGPDRQARLPTSSNATVAYVDRASRFRFDVPSAPTRVESRRFDPSTPPGKVKERFEIKREGRLLVRVDAWTNPGHLTPRAWIDRHAAYLKKGGTGFDKRRVGPEGLWAVVADTPSSCQAPHLVTALLTIREHVVAVTCTNGDDPAARGAFDTVLGSIRMEVEP